MLEKSTKRPLNKYISLASIPFQIGSIVYVSSYFGKVLDFKYGFVKTPWVTIVFVIFGLALSFYSIIKQLQRMNKNE